MGLAKGWRLEPTATLPDVSNFENIVQFPATVLFWAPQEESWVKHRNPLLDPEIGIGLRSFAVDFLHTLNLGIYQIFLAKAGGPSSRSTPLRSCRLWQAEGT
jgi:hypothetical protein